MPDPDTNIEVAIEKLIYGGQGLARDGSRVIFVPFVLPGEGATVRVTTEKKGLAEARLEELLAPVPGRTDPPCPFFFHCGGCQYQHAEYDFQLAQKRAILGEVLQRVGKFAPPEDIPVISGAPWDYRNRTQFHLLNGEIGYFRPGSHNLIPVDRCPISSPKINEALTGLRRMIRERRFPDFVRSIELFTNEEAVQLNVLETGQPVSKRFFEWCAETIPGYADDAIEYTVEATAYRVRHRSFFQVNRFLLEQMIDTALEGAEGATALDLYSGVGLFSIPLARKFGAVTAVESSGSASRDLEFNAARADVGVAVRHEPVEAYLEQLQERPDFVLADPPRAGLGKFVVKELLRLKPPAIHIVSCDPSTLARDLAPLLTGGYELSGLTLLDLFPQTFHIETMARLRLR